jgi:hypothetical protein
LFNEIWAKYSKTKTLGLMVHKIQWIRSIHVGGGEEGMNPNKQTTTKSLVMNEKMWGIRRDEDGKLEKRSSDSGRRRRSTTTNATNQHIYL